MSSDKNRIGIRVLIHRSFQTSRQVFLERSIFDNGNPQCIRIPQHSLILTFRYALDLLDMVDFEAIGVAAPSLDQEGHKDGPLGMGMDAAVRAAIEGSKE